MKKSLFVLFTVICIFGCTTMETQEEVIDRAAISKEITDVMKNYGANWSADADALMGYYFESPEFKVVMVN